MDFPNVSVYQLTFFHRSAAASLASPPNKDTTSHSYLLFDLTVGRLGAYSKKDMIFGSVPKYD